MRSNEMYEPSRESERDFCFRARVGGAMIGYDTSGTTWAVYDEAAAEPSITYTEQDPVVWANVPTGDGNTLEWTEEGRYGPEITFRLSLGCPVLRYDVVSKFWAEDHEEEDSLVWYPSPTIPADRIEEMARELFQKGSE